MSRIEGLCALQAEDEELEVEGVEVEDFDDEEIEDDEEHFEIDDAPARQIPEWSWSPFGPAFGKIGVGTPNGAYSPARRRSPQITMPSPNEEGTDPRTRLQAITAEIDARKPRSAAIKLLVEAASYLRGSGGGVLRQYGKARGCAADDIAAAERTIMADRDRGRA